MKKCIKILFIFIFTIILLGIFENKVYAIYDVSIKSGEKDIPYQVSDSGYSTSVNINCSDLYPGDEIAIKFTQDLGNMNWGPKILMKVNIKDESLLYDRNYEKKHGFWYDSAIFTGKYKLPQGETDGFTVAFFYEGDECDNPVWFRFNNVLKTDELEKDKEKAETENEALETFYKKNISELTAADYKLKYLRSILYNDGINGNTVLWDKFVRETTPEQRKAWKKDITLNWRDSGKKYQSAIDTLQKQIEVDDGLASEADLNNTKQEAR